MQTTLTPTLLEFLNHQGYKYFLSKTMVTDSLNGFNIKVILTPVVNRPDVRSLPQGFDTYFQINKEPRQMAQGIDDTEVTVRLSEDDRNVFERLNLRVG
jgi:hypothetical protein